MTQPRKHRHAEMIRRWLDDDSLEVEWLTSLGKWESEPDPDWDEGTELRFRPKMITVGEHSFPHPMRVAPEIGTRYWVVDLTRSDLCWETSWMDGVVDKGYLERGICHTTQSDCAAHARALIALTEVNCE